MSTVECCCNWLVSPGIFDTNVVLYSKRLTLITLRLAEFGFFGDIVKTLKQTAFFLWVFF